MKSFMKLSSFAAVLLMGWLCVRAGSAAMIGCSDSADQWGAVLRAMTLCVLWGAIMVLTFWLHVSLDKPRTDEQCQKS